MWATQNVVLGSQEMTCMEQAVKEERCEGAVLLWVSWWAVILKVSLVLVKLSRSSHLVFVYDTAEFLLNSLKVVISVTLSWMKSKKIRVMSQHFDEISLQMQRCSMCACTQGVGNVYSGCRESCTLILLVYEWTWHILASPENIVPYVCINAYRCSGWNRENIPFFINGLK